MTIQRTYSPQPACTAMCIANACILALSLGSLMCGKKAPPARAQFFVVSAEVRTVLNARAQPSTEAAVLFTLRSGEIVEGHASGERTGGQHTWVAIVKDGRVAWVAKNYVEGPFSRDRATARGKELHGVQEAKRLAGGWCRPGGSDCLSDLVIQQAKGTCSIEVRGPVTARYEALKCSCLDGTCTFKGGVTEFVFAFTSKDDLEVMSSTESGGERVKGTFHPAATISVGEKYHRVPKY